MRGGRELRVTVDDSPNCESLLEDSPPPRYSCSFALSDAAALNRTCIIINPAARGAQSRLARLQKIAKWCRDQGDDRSRVTPRRRRNARVEQGYQTIVAAGGDGTVNEVVNGIGMRRRGFALGILPMGTVNVFAMELGIPFGAGSGVESHPCVSTRGAADRPGQRQRPLLRPNGPASASTRRWRRRTAARSRR